MLFDSFEAYSVPEIRKEAKAEAKIDALMIVLAEKGALSVTLQETILKQADVSIIDEWIRMAAKCLSVEEFEKQII